MSPPGHLSLLFFEESTSLLLLEEKAFASILTQEVCVYLSMKIHLDQASRHLTSRIEHHAYLYCAYQPPAPRKSTYSYFSSNQSGPIEINRPIYGTIDGRGQLLKDKTEGQSCYQSGDL